MPTPNQDETKQEFVSRCIKVLMDEGSYPQKQCIAICYSMWKNKGKSNEEIVTDIEDKVMAYLYNEEGTCTKDIDTTIAAPLKGGKKKKKRGNFFRRLQSNEK